MIRPYQVIIVDNPGAQRSRDGVAANRGLCLSAERPASLAPRPN